jgi:hypothetical protein
MNRYVSPILRCRSRMMFSTWAWIDTSSALTGSSAMISSGCRISARVSGAEGPWGFHAVILTAITTNDVLL